MLAKVAGDGRGGRCGGGMGLGGGMSGGRTAGLALGLGLGIGDGDLALLPKGAGALESRLATLDSSGGLLGADGSGLAGAELGSPKSPKSLASGSGLDALSAELLDSESLPVGTIRAGAVEANTRCTEALIGDSAAGEGFGDGFAGGLGGG